MSVREDREVAAPPAMTLAALATAAENLGWTVRDVRAKPGLLLVTTKPSLRGGSLGFIVTARARRFNEGTRLSLDATPLLGRWARKSADGALDDLVHEFQLVMRAPRGRIRRPQRASRGTLPFGQLPVLLAVLWALTATVVYGVLFGGWWWIGAGSSMVGAVLLLARSSANWWTHTITVLAVASLPFGLVGLVARRMAKTNHLWEGTIGPFQ